MHNTVTSPPFSKYSQIIPSRILLKKFSKNQFYEPTMFLVEHSEMITSHTQHMRGCIFSATEYGICYFDLQTNKVLNISFNELDSVIKNQTSDDKANSLWLHMIKEHCYHLPDLLYHLAAIITTKYPYMSWNIENQLLDFEQKLVKKGVTRSFDKQLKSTTQQSHIIIYRQWCDYFQALKHPTQNEI
jgi:hypothetical protein